MIDLINYFKDKTAEISEVKHFDLWNNQIYNEHIENSFNTPAVFLDFPQIIWDTSTGQQHMSNILYNQKGNIMISIWLVVNSLSTYLETFANVVSPVRNSLLAKFNLQEVLGTGTLVRVSEEFDNNHDAVSYWKITFNLSITETLTDTELQEVMANLDLNITAPVINPIRSNTGVNQ